MKSESAPIVYKTYPEGLDPTEAGRNTSDSEVKMLLTLRMDLLSLFAATLCSKAEPVPILHIVAMAKPCVIQIGAFDEHWPPTKSGTGFFISSDGLLLANYHAFEGALFLGGRTAQGAIFILIKLVLVWKKYIH